MLIKNNNSKTHAQCTIPKPVSGIFILQSEVKPESSGCNELRYNLDTDTIAAIFKTYPAGKTLLLLHMKATVL